MGTHTWNEDCPACGYSGMTVYSDRENLGAYCPICGYERHMEENIPSEDDIELAKKLLSEMSAEQLEQALVECEEKDIVLVEKFGGGTDGREEEART